MEKTLTKENPMNKLTWLARLLILAEAVFLAANSFDPIEDVFILLIPTYILILILLLSWRSLKAASIASLLTAVAYTFLFRTYEYYLSFIVLSMPLIIAFFCFLSSHILSRED